MKYKLLALDMDGTLLNSAKEISPGTMAAIARIADMGVHVCLATGRSISECGDYVPDIKDKIRYGILNSSALIMDLKENRPVFTSIIDKDIAEKYIKAGLSYGAMIQLHTLSVGAAPAEDLKDLRVFHMGVYQSMFDRLCRPVDDILAYAAEHHDEITKICAYCRNVEDRELLYKEVKGYDLEYAYSEVTSLEATSPGISKGRGIKYMCSHLGIDISETVAVGDAPNDISMMDVAGLSVAMGNSIDDIKARCDMVTADNDHDGIAELIDRIWGV